MCGVKALQLSHCVLQFSFLSQGGDNSTLAVACSNDLSLILDKGFMEMQPEKKAKHKFIHELRKEE